jgi:hypothetical protein
MSPHQITSDEAREAQRIVAEMQGGHRNGPRDGSIRLLDFDGLRRLSDFRYRIDGVLPAEGVSAIYGAAGGFKSFVAIDMAHCVATGTSWQGRTVQPGLVVYIAAEGRAGLKRRVVAWWEHHGRPDMSRIRWLPDAVNLRDKGTVKRARDVFAELPEQPCLVVVDTMARSMVGGDENAAQDVGEFIAGTDALAHGGAALVIHHTGKDGEKERGSTALRGAVEMLAKLAKTGGLRTTLECDKARDFEPWAPITLELEPHGESLAVARSDGDPVKAEVLEVVQGALLPMTKRAVREAVKRKHDSVDGALDELVSEGVLVLTGDGYKPRAPTPGHTGTHPGPPGRGGVPREGTPP